jgi:hypothetical protein
MWRREEELDYWLNERPVSTAPNQDLKHREKPPGKVWPWGFKRNVREHSLEIHSEAIILDGVLSVPVLIKDGLGEIGARLERSDQNTPGAFEASNEIHEAILIGKTRVESLRLPDKENTKIKQAILAIIPYCRRIHVSIGPVPVHIPGSVQLHPPLVGGQGALISDSPPIRSLTQMISAKAIRQAGINVRTLSESEYNRCLQEAEQIKGIPVDKCKLITLFRHVPIEMVSKLQFLGDKKEIVYTLSPGLNRSSTRVYDLMAIRDVSRKEVHLIPHRTRNRMVRLN